MRNCYFWLGTGIIGPPLKSWPGSKTAPVWGMRFVVSFSSNDIQHIIETEISCQPVPDSLLINGMGYFECSKATLALPVNCSDVKRPHIILDKKLRYRFRLVNVG